MSFIRQHNFIPTHKLKSATVMFIGCGNVGSVTAVTLAKMGVGQFILIDRDVIDDHNIPNQWYVNGSAGSQKVHALSYMIRDLSPHGSIVSTSPINSYFNMYHMFYMPDIVIVGTDSTVSRINILSKLTVAYDNYINKDFLFIDVGTNELNIRCNAFMFSNEEKRNKYYALLKEFEKTNDRRVCGRSSIMFVGTYIASVVGAVLYKHFNNMPIEFQTIINTVNNHVFEFPLPKPVKQDITETTINFMKDNLELFIKRRIEKEDIYLLVTFLSNKTEEVAKGIFAHTEQERKLHDSVVIKNSCFSCLCMNCKHNKDCSFRTCNDCMRNVDKRIFVKKCDKYEHIDRSFDRDHYPSQLKQFISSFNTINNLTDKQLDEIIKSFGVKKW